MGYLLLKKKALTSYLDDSQHQILFTYFSLSSQDVLIKILIKIDQSIKTGSLIISNENHSKVLLTSIESIMYFSDHL